MAVFDESSNLCRPCSVDRSAEKVQPGTQGKFRFDGLSRPAEALQPRAIRTRSAPSDASSRAIASPIPLLPPVTRARAPSSRQSCLLDIAQAVGGNGKSFVAARPACLGRRGCFPAGYCADPACRRSAGRSGKLRLRSFCTGMPRKDLMPTGHTPRDNPFPGRRSGPPHPDCCKVPVWSTSPLSLAWLPLHTRPWATSSASARAFGGLRTPA